jgi:hypothetical protein
MNHDDIQAALHHQQQLEQQEQEPLGSAQVQACLLRQDRGQHQRGA